MRYASGKPFVLVENFVPESVFPGIDAYDFAQRSLYDVFETVYHEKIVKSRRVLMAQTADVEFAIRAQGEFDPRIIRADLHVAVIRHRDDGSHRAVAVDIDRHGLIIALHHHAEHTRRGHQPPHRRRADGR